MKNNIEQALEDLKNGKLIIVVDDPDRENEGDLVGLIDFMKPEDINFMISKAKGLLCAPISIEIAKKMNINITKKGISDGTNFTESIDSLDSTTGVSVIERFNTIKNLTSKEQIKFKKPGHIFPLIAKPKGLSKRKGHTEAAIDLAKLLNCSQVGVIIEITDDDGTMMKQDQLEKFAKKENLTIITIANLIKYIQDNRPEIWTENEELSELLFSEVSSLPTQNGEMNIQQVKDYLSGMEATLYWKGNINNVKNVRIHSQCVTSEVFGSYRCDCSQQLDFFIDLIHSEGSSLLIYTYDEGRGIGLFNKINAYKKQDEGLDTVKANIEIGLPSENRNFKFPGKILKKLGLNSINLFSNNPHKINGIEKMEIKVNRKSLWVNRNKEEKFYIQTKKDKMGHLD